jgi:two-component system nitrate/nitrite response regulator NarL
MTMETVQRNRERAEPASFGERRSLAPAPVRIVIANNHSILRAGLRSFLEGEPDFRIIGEADTTTDAVAIVAERKPDVVLLDAAVSELSGLDALERLRGFPASRVILLTTSVEPTFFVRALQLGVRGVVLRNTAAPLLFKCIRVVVSGEYWIPRGLMSSLVQLLLRMPLAEAVQPLSIGLTDRERHVLELVVTGHTNREISQKLTVTADTVKHHLTSMFDKTGASNRLELALFALHRQLVDNRAAS